MECESQPYFATESFSDPDSDSQSLSRWQISKDSDFAVLTMDVTTDGGLTELTVPRGVLEPATTYYVRVRFYDAHLDPSGWSDTIEITTKADMNDLNSDGIPDEKEVGYGIDMDGNGVEDVEERDRIKSVRSVDGGVTIGISKASNSITDIEVADTIDPAALENDGNRPELLFGLFSYRVQVDKPGAVARVTIYFSEFIPNATAFYKYNTIDGWIDYSEHVIFHGDGRSITLEVTDGGQGDSDGVANGVIVDPGGLSDGTESSFDSFTSSAESGGGGGGCYVTATGFGFGSEEPPHQRIKFVTKARKYEDTKIWAFLLFVICAVRLENSTCPFVAVMLQLMGEG